MSGPRFTILARIDDVHFISACPHGVAHLTWERLTLRFKLDEFRELACLLREALGDQARPVRHCGELPLAFRPGDPCEVQVGVMVLRLAPREFGQLADAVVEAQNRLDQIVASGEWDEPEPEPRRDPFDDLKQNPFSAN